MGLHRHSKRYDHGQNPHSRSRANICRRHNMLHPKRDPYSPTTEYRRDQSFLRVKQIAVFSPDGRKFRRFNHQHVMVQVSVVKTTGLTRAEEQTPYIIPDDSVVRFSYTPASDDATVIVRVR